ncbi:MAG: hypothetical protein HPY85_13285 [Anaerolineae bacterium]|nr:hypothetical protein [Anaerolineae bacterium]
MKRLGMLFVLAVLVLLLALPQPVAAGVAADEQAPDDAAVVGTPVLVEPHKNQKTAVRPTFVWETVPGGTKYTLEIKKVSDNSVAFKATYAAAVRCTADLCTVALNTDLPVGDYKWHVVAYDAVGKGAWSIYHTFSAWDTTLAQVSLRSPGANALVYGGRPTFKWYSNGAGNYYLQLRSAAGEELGFWSTSSEVCVTYCEFRIPLNLNSNYGDYQWRVQGYDTIGEGVGPWSSWRTFSYTRIARPTRISLADGSTTGAHQPTFEFGAVDGAIYYLFEIFDADTDDLYYQKKALAADICPGVTCELPIDSMLPGGNYKWHVRGQNGTNFGYWTGWWTFTISGSTAKYTTTFGSDPTDWADPDNRWAWDGISYYQGQPSAVCWHFCALTYYPQNYTDATLIITLRSTGTDADDGYKILWRALYDASGDLLQAYELSVTQSGADMVASIKRYDNGTTYTLGSTTIPSQSISNFHTVEIRLDHHAFQLLYNGSDMGTYNVMLDSYYYGTFAVDVTSPPGGVHRVEIDTVDIEVPGS